MLENNTRIFMMPELLLAWLFAIAVTVAICFAVAGYLLTRRNPTLDLRKKAARSTEDPKNGDSEKRAA
jgi:hypothetical protein